MTPQQKPIGKQQKSCTKTRLFQSSALWPVDDEAGGIWYTSVWGLPSSLETTFTKCRNPGHHQRWYRYQSVRVDFLWCSRCFMVEPRGFPRIFNLWLELFFCSQMGCSHGNNFHNFRNHCQSKFTIYTRITLGTMIIQSWSWTLEDVFFWRIGSCRIL